MQNIKYNNKDYTFFNTGEHYFTEKISYPLKKYDGYTVVSIFCDEVSYINTLPVILDASSMNIKYNTPGRVFIPMNEKDEYYDIGKHIVIISKDKYDKNDENDLRFRLYNNYSLCELIEDSIEHYNHYSNNTSYEPNLQCFYINKIPVISNNDEIGISLEENASLKLKRYLK